MGYLSVWKVLEEMVTDFRKKGITIPADVVSSLRHAKTLINILKADPRCVDTEQKIEEYLRRVESSLVSEGQKTLGTDYVEKWLKRLNEASRKIYEEAKKEARFIPGLPRKHKWIRVKPSTELPVERLKTLAEETGLSCTLQNDGYLLIYGEDECIKDFVKKMATKYGLKAGK